VSNLKQQLAEWGYVVLRGVLSSVEAAHYRAEIQKLSSVSDAVF
jgi:hypothetical protein